VFERSEFEQIPRKSTEEPPGNQADWRTARKSLRGALLLVTFLRRV